MTFIGVTSTSYQVEKRDWLLSLAGVMSGQTPTATLDVSAFTAGTHYPNGYIPSGTAVSKLASGLWGPFNAAEASGEHGLIISSTKVPNPADTTQDVGVGLVVTGASIDHNKLPSTKPTLAALRTALPQCYITDVTP